MSEKKVHNPDIFQNVNGNEIKYIEIIIALCIKHIQGKPQESFGSKFKIENSAVNASGCEFLDLLLKYIENKFMISKVLIDTIDPLLHIMSYAIKNDDFVIEVQMLNIFTLILQKNVLCKDETDTLIQQNFNQTLDLLQSPKFLISFLNGLNSPYSFVRIQFVNFFWQQIPTLSQLFPQQYLKESVTIILKQYYTQLNSLMNDECFYVPQFEENSNLQIQDKPGNGLDQQLFDQEVQFQEDEFVSKNGHDIYSVLYGMKKIYFYFLGFQTQQLEEWEKIEQFNKQGMISFVKDVFTLNFFSTPVEKESHKKNWKDYDHPETCQAIMQDILMMIEVYVSCWVNSKDFLGYVEFYENGIMPYRFQKLNNFNKILSDKLKSFSEVQKSTKNEIINVLKPLTLSFTTEIIETFLNLWIKNQEKKLVPRKQMNDQTTKTIEIMIMLNIPPDQLIEYLIKTTAYQNVITHHNKKQPKKNLLNYNIALVESQIMSFVYTYLNYNLIDSNSLKREYLMAIWNVMLKFIKGFEKSKNPSTLIWQLEVLFLLSKKYSPKEILNDYQFKKQLHNLINDLLQQVTQFACNNSQVVFQDAENSQENIFKTVLPLPPHICEIYHEEFLSYNGDNEKNQILELLFKQNWEEASLIQIYRIQCIKTLNNIGLELLQNTYSPDTTDRIVTHTKEFMDPIFGIIDNRSPDNMVYVECGTELLYSLLDHARMLLIGDFKKSILNSFMAQDFFRFPRKVLKMWKKIINWVVTMDKTDIFSDLLAKMSSFSLFFSKDTEIKNKIKSFERICFIIYGGEQDKYEKKLSILLEKIADVIKTAEQQPPSLLILIIFCMRVLILRLSQKTLILLFRNIWPMLLTLLMQIFKKSSLMNQKKQMKDPNLILSALKLIELISVVNLDEFNVYQWVFVFDYFGLRIDVQDDKVLLDEEEESNQNTNYVTPFEYQPYLTNILANKFNLNYESQQYEQEIQTSFEKRKRQIKMTYSNSDTEIEIQNSCLWLCQYLISNNEQRTQIDIAQIEGLIDNDFIHLDELIQKA